MDNLTPGQVSDMTLSVPDADSIVGKQGVSLTVKYKVGSYFPLNGLITMKFPAYYSHTSDSYSMVRGSFTFGTAPVVSGSPTLQF